MASNSMINLKVFLRDDGTTDARRFTVDASVVTSYFFMKEKLQTVFPTLREAEFKITWKDADGDEITIASDEDFITAFTEMNSDVKVLHVTVLHRNQEPIFVEAEAQDAPFRGPRIICDVCNQIIMGFRYKCLQCPDYDLCTTCEHQGHHSDHLMIRVPNNDIYMPKCARKFMHHIARNLKKSAHVAGKEAHRAAKFACKFGPMGNMGNMGNPGNPGKCSEENKNEQPQPSSSNQSNQSESRGCPFPGEGVNMNDFHALGAMARQHLGPLLDVLQTPQGESGDGTNEGGLFMDIIRNAVDGFFGRVPETPNSSETQNEKPQEEKSQSQPQPQSQPQAPQQPAEQPQNQAVPMDVEPPREGPHVTFAEPNPPSSEGRRDPGWTFVANQVPPKTNESENKQAGQPNAPTFVYHENPKIAEGLVQLYEMGFSNESGVLTHLLERFDGNVSAVVKAIVDMKP